MTRNLLAAIFCLLLGCLPGSAADLPESSEEAPPLRFQRLTMTDGLSHNRVFDIVQDPAGFIWLATQKGLNRYDGHRIKSFHRDPTNPQALADDYIFDLEIEGTELWMSTKDGAVQRFETRSEQVEHFGFDPDRGTDPRLEMALCLDRVSGGDLWVGTQSGLFQLDFRNRWVRHPSLPLVEVHSILERHPGILWIGTADGVYESTLTSGQSKRLELHPAIDHTEVYQFLVDHQERIWVATVLGLVRIDPDGKAQKVLNTTVHILYEDREGVLWVGTLGEGLVRIDPQSGSLSKYKNDPLDRHSLSSNIVFSIAEDNSGLLWIGTNGGVNILEPSLQAFTVYRRESEILFRNIFAMEQDVHGQLWLGSFGEGLIRLDANRKNAEQWLHQSKDPASLSHNFVWDVHAGSDGTLWVGTEVALGRIPSDQLKQANPRMDHFRHRPGDATSLTRGRVNEILEDRRGRLWVGTRNGLSMLDPITGKSRQFVHDPDDPASLPLPPVLLLYEDDDGDIWIGFDGAGLSRLDPETGRAVHYMHDPKDERTLGGEIVTAILPGPSDSLWVASYGGGVEQFFPTTGEFVDVLPRDFPKNPNVSNLVADDQGALWFSVGPEIYRMHAETREITSTDPGGGLISGYPPKSALQLSTGEVLWGGNEGFVGVFPQRIPVYDEPPPVVLTDFRVLDRQIDAGEWRSGHVTLTHRDKLFWIDFAALHFAASNKNRYSYRLAGLNDTWIEADASMPHAQFSSLKPGSYEFQVRASNKDNVWNNEGASINIVVRPPFWKTWWAYSVYIVCLVAAGLTYVISLRRKLIRERRIAERERTVNLKLREVDKLKDEMIAEKEERVRILSGLLPICMSCKKIRDSRGSWHQLEAYIDHHSEASFSHGICPSCMQHHYPGVDSAT